MKIINIIIFLKVKYKEQNKKKSKNFPTIPY